MLQPSRLTDKIASQKSQLRKKLNTTQFSVKGAKDHRISVLTGFKETHLISSDEDDSDEEDGHPKECDMISRISRPRHEETTNISSINLGSLGTPKNPPSQYSARRSSTVIMEIPERDEGNARPKQAEDEEEEDILLDRAPSTDSAAVHEDECRETFICSNTKVMVGVHHDRSKSGSSRNEMSKFSGMSNNVSITSRPPPSGKAGKRAPPQAVKMLPSDFDSMDISHQHARSPKANESTNDIIYKTYHQTRERIRMQPGE